MPYGSIGANLFTKPFFFGALAAPGLIAFDAGPLPSLYNQTIALALWGIFAWLHLKDQRYETRRSGTTWVAAVAACICLLYVVSFIATSYPRALVTSNAAITLSAAVITLTASAIRCTKRPSVPILFVGFVALTAVLDCFPAIFEIISGTGSKIHWIAPAWSNDRISGNLRQPNLLATALACGLAALIALSEMNLLPLWAQRILSLLLLFVLSATGSRVGALEVVALSVWGAVDRRLSARSRITLLLYPAVLAVCWCGLRYWSSTTGIEHGRAPDLTSGRYAMWQQCLSLISSHPWFGVGLGNFNFAWTLTPFDRSNPETFDHAHNLILQWAVELGIPITLLLIALFGRSLWLCVQRTRQTTGDESVVRRFCLVMIKLVLIHSMTEYPLWYAYFLLPTAFAWGIAAAPPGPAARPAVDARASMAAISSQRPATNWLGTCGLLMALGAAFAMYDYQKIVTIYHPWDGAPPIEERVAAGRKSILYGYLADRFAGTLAVKGTRTLEPYKTATRQLLDMRLLIAWSLAMEETGHLDKARYLAQRVKDFNDPVAQQFFVGCKSPSPGTALPWQCTPPSGRYSYRDFL